MFYTKTHPYCLIRYISGQCTFKALACVTGLPVFLVLKMSTQSFKGPAKGPDYLSSLSLKKRLALQNFEVIRHYSSHPIHSSWVNDIKDMKVRKKARQDNWYKELLQHILPLPTEAED